MGGPKKPKRLRSLFKEPSEGKPDFFRLLDRRKTAVKIFFAKIALAFLRNRTAVKMMKKKRKSIFQMA